MRKQQGVVEWMNLCHVNIWKKHMNYTSCLDVYAAGSRLAFERRSESLLPQTMFMNRWATDLLVCVINRFISSNSRISGFKKKKKTAIIRMFVSRQKLWFLRKSVTIHIYNKGISKQRTLSATLAHNNKSEKPKGKWSTESLKPLHVDCHTAITMPSLGCLEGRKKMHQSKSCEVEKSI